MKHFTKTCLFLFAVLILVGCASESALLPLSLSNAASLAGADETPSPSRKPTLGRRTACFAFPRCRPPCGGGVSLKNQKYREEIMGLVAVKKIYLGDFGNEEGSDLVREKVRKYLSESNRFETVENEKYADAVLTGVAGVEKSYSQNSNGVVSTDYAGIGMLRLIDLKSEKTVWNFEYKRGFMLWGSVSSRVAHQITQRLLGDAQMADGYNASTTASQIITK